MRFALARTLSRYVPLYLYFISTRRGRDQFHSAERNHSYFLKARASSRTSKMFCHSSSNSIVHLILQANAGWSVYVKTKSPYLTKLTWKRRCWTCQATTCRFCPVKFSLDMGFSTCKSCICLIAKSARLIPQHSED